MTDYAKEVKSRYVVPFSFVLSLMGFVNAYIYHKFDATILVNACLVSGACAIPVCLMPSRIKFHNLYANYIVALFCLCVSFVALFTGAVQSNAIWWLGTIPLLATFLLNAFFGVLWFVVIVGLFLTAVYLQNQGLVPVNILMNADMTNRVIISFTLNSSLIFVLCVLTELIREKSFIERGELAAKTLQLNQLASLGKLASGVAHEINNPLMVIRGAQFRISRLIKQDQEMDKHALADNMEKINKNVIRIQEITSLMRTISSAAGNRKISEIKLQDLIQEVIQMFSEDITERNIEFVTELPKESIHFRGIYPELFQAFFNLIENAVFELRELSQSSKRVTIRLNREDHQIIVLIQDNGRGIPFTIRDHIFDPFFTTKNPGSGRGLGLNFSYNVFTSNGGSIELLEADNGSLFKLVLPI
jgi:signal transduction histidine kinase